MLMGRKCLMPPYTYLNPQSSGLLSIRLSDKWVSSSRTFTPFNLAVELLNGEGGSRTASRSHAHYNGVPGAATVSIKSVEAVLTARRRLPRNNLGLAPALVVHLIVLALLYEGFRISLGRTFHALDVFQAFSLLGLVRNVLHNVTLCSLM